MDTLEKYMADKLSELRKDLGLNKHEGLRVSTSVVNTGDKTVINHKVYTYTPDLSATGDTFDNAVQKYRMMWALDKGIPSQTEIVAALPAPDPALVASNAAVDAEFTDVEPDSLAGCDNEEEHF